MATETLRANSLVKTSGTGSLSDAGFAYDSNYSTYAYCTAQSTGSGTLSAVFTATWAAKSRTWSSYKIRLFFQDVAEYISGYGGSVLVEYTTDGTNYTTALLDGLVTADYSFTPLEVAKTGDTNLSNFKVRVTVTSFRTETPGEWGDIISCRLYELELVGTYTPTSNSPAFLLNFV